MYKSPCLGMIIIKSFQFPPLLKVRDDLLQLEARPEISFSNESSSHEFDKDVGGQAFCAGSSVHVRELVQSLRLGRFVHTAINVTSFVSPRKLDVLARSLGSHRH